MERKLAAVVFVDLVDSTGLVAGSDPEVARRRVTAYFDRVAHCIEGHGGTVEKFAGDAVMAAFGVPRAHEDDGQRAVRAAFAVLEAVHELGLEARVGVEAGEVVVEDGDSTFATGDAVHLAARLQQAAGAGEILLGPGARRLTAGAVDVEDVGPLDVRGREGPVWTWRALGLVADGGPRRAETPFVGREAELDLLENTYSRTVRQRSAHLVTVFGEPGVGKTRLVTEFGEGTERATILTGRCLPYGEGVTYWPIAEMVKASAGITDDDPANEAFEKLRTSCESEAVAELLATALGVLGAEEDGKAEELTWAVRRWAEELASGQPLVLIFEDVNWGDEQLLELIEHLARSLRSAAVLLICVTRPELLDARPAWGGGNTRAAAIELGPLEPDESERLVDELLAGRDLPAEQRALVVEKAEGNPLFLEETARMLAEANGEVDGVLVPDTVQALIAARIDRLSPDEKRALRGAAVIGRSFWLDPLRTIEPTLDLTTLVERLHERALVVPEERSTISGERAFRFAHGLIREVAYAGVSKSDRAEAHRSFASWLAERAPDELVEVRAHHLDQACALLAELDGVAPPELVAEAAATLEAGARRALAREAIRVARRLALRAVELEPTLERRFLAARAAQRSGELEAVAREMEVVRREAKESGKAAIEGRALRALAEVALNRTGDTGQVAALARDALAVLPEEDVEGRFEALMALYDSVWYPGELSAGEEHVAEALRLAEEAGRSDLAAEARGRLAWIASMRLELGRAEELVGRQFELMGESGSLREQARARHDLASVRRLQGRLDEAEAGFEESRRRFEEIDDERRAAWSGVYLAWVVWIRGDRARAERLLRHAVRVYTRIGDRGFLCEAQRALAELLLDRGELEEAERLALEARRTVAQSDLTSLGTTTSTLGLVRVAQGRHEEAEALLREAVDMYEGTDFKALRCEPASALAQFLLERGRDAEARELLATLPDPVPGWMGRADARIAALIA